eukprot:15403-Rhodomonas_salina.1
MASAIRKPDADARDYRLIKLDNELEIVLVSCGSRSAIECFRVLTESVCRVCAGLGPRDEHRGSSSGCRGRTVAGSPRSAGCADVQGTLESPISTVFARESLVLQLATNARQKLLSSIALWQINFCVTHAVVFLLAGRAQDTPMRGLRWIERCITSCWRTTSCMTRWTASQASSPALSSPRTSRIASSWPSTLRTTRTCRQNILLKDSSSLCDVADPGLLLAGGCEEGVSVVALDCESKPPSSALRDWELQNPA